LKNQNHKKKLTNEGHRKRLREKFLDSGLSGFLDYEVIELLLTLGTPRRDCKQPAKEALLKFKSLTKVLDSTVEELQQIKGVGPSNVFGIKLFHAIFERYSKEKIQPDILLNSSSSIFNYLREKIGREKKECFVVLCFDTKSRLIVDEVSIGTLNASLIHPREVFNLAVKNHTSHIIVAHNHPSGDPTPSPEDIATTKRLVEAGKILGITVVDHIVVTNNSYSSHKEMGLI